MDGRDSSGRTISLLNASSTDSASDRNPYGRGDWKRLQHFPLAQRAASSSSSCCATSPSLSPSAQTPPTLSRSSSSSDARHLAPISPLTPSDPDAHYLDNVFRSHKHLPHHQQYFLARPSQGKMDDQNVSSMYPPIPDAAVAMTSAYPMPAHLAQQLPPQQQPPPQQQQAAAPPQSLYRSSTSPSSEPSRVSTVSATSNAKSSQSKKNSYPCPMAKQYGCTDFFTTSGHAARHAKKHTGKKDAFCPECNKAFTRKDNMEQHRRTHQNGRAPRAANSSTSDDGKVKKPTKQSSAKKIKAEPQAFEAAVEQQLAEQPQPVPAMASMPAPEVQPMASMSQPMLDQTLMMPNAVGGPYFMNGPLVDVGPVPSLPMAVPGMTGRPPLHRTNFTNNLDFMSPAAPVGIMADPDSLHYSYPSPGLSNGLNSLALASEHRRLSEEKAQSQSPQETPSTETPLKETETP